MRFSPGSLTSSKKASRAANSFADLVGRVINCTVSEAPIAFVQVEADEFRGYVGHCPTRVPAPMPLRNGRFLYVNHRLCLRREEQFLTTLGFEYAYQATRNEDSWIFRYEYEREPAEPYPYPLCHLHVNACPDGYAGSKEFSKLHLPLGNRMHRVTVEAIVRHLMAEHEIEPISDRWEEVLSETEAAYDKIQAKRVTPT